jgi:hypothetical protein
VSFLSLLVGLLNWSVSVVREYRLVDNVKTRTSREYRGVLKYLS